MKTGPPCLTAPLFRTGYHRHAVHTLKKEQILLITLTLISSAMAINGSHFFRRPSIPPPLQYSMVNERTCTAKYSYIFFFFTFKISTTTVLVESADSCFWLTANEAILFPVDWAAVHLTTLYYTYLYRIYFFLPAIPPLATSLFVTNDVTFKNY